MFPEWLRHRFINLCFFRHQHIFLCYSCDQRPVNIPVPFLPEIIIRLDFCFPGIVFPNLFGRKIRTTFLKYLKLLIFILYDFIDCIGHHMFHIFQKCIGFKILFLWLEEISFIHFPFFDDFTFRSDIAILVKDFLFRPYMLSIFIIEHISAGYFAFHLSPDLPFRKNQMNM